MNCKYVKIMQSGTKFESALNALLIVSACAIIAVSIVEAFGLGDYL